MKLIAPIPRDYDLLSLIRSNITEFYFGYIPDFWREKYSLLNSINRRYTPVDQCSSINAIKKILKEFKCMDIKFSMAINAHFYTTKQINAIIKTLEQFYSMGLDGVIVADIGLILQIKKYLPKMKIHLSCIAACLNSYAVKFFQEIGATRIILPRSVGISEVGSIRAKNKNIELEIISIALESYCLNIDGLCMHHHGKDTIVCSCYEENLYLRSARVTIPDDPLQRIYHSFKSGVDYLKFPRRGETAREMITNNKLAISLVNKMSEANRR
jgi:putative protease